MTISAPTHNASRRSLGRSFKGVVALLAFVVTLAAPGLVAAWDPNSYSSPDEALLVQLTNQARAAAGLRALTADSTLTSVARWRSKDMIDRGYFSHSIPPNGTKWYNELDRIGYCYTSSGENLGNNNFPDDSATATIQDGFMGSSTHWANILGNWTVMGVGAYKGADGKHVWTVLFAIKCGSAPAATPKPAPTATPKPAPTATPEPAPTATPKPAPTATREPAPTATPKPAPTATPKPTVAPSLSPSPSPSARPAVTVPPTQAPTVEPAVESTPEPTSAPTPAATTPAATPPAPSPTADGSASAPSSGTDVEPGSLQVTDAPFAGNLVDTIVGDVAGAYFGF
ncbi:MAG: CAP domain-containing protein [Candidatus Limnocylindrales bacterium]